jgi:hypothetical protein
VQRKKPPEGGLNSNLMIVNQTDVNAAFDFRRRSRAARLQILID